MGFGKQVQITRDNNNVSVRDFGRGIPLRKVVACVSKINTGAKYNDDVFQFSVGLNVAVFAAAAIAARPVIGRLANRYGRRAVMIGGALIAASGGFGISQVDEIMPLLGFRLLTGVGEAAMFVGAATLIADLSPRDRRAEGGTIIDTSAFTDYGIYAAGDYPFEFKDFTLIGPTTNPASGYGLKVSGDEAGVIIENVTVQDSGRSGFDLNGITSGALNALVAEVLRAARLDSPQPGN